MADLHKSAVEYDQKLCAVQNILNKNINATHL